ncbi:unnamed protein product [Angiostrongylus costaricensis]|uniref:Protein croquemort n=1 Tax=Angiostrongylus costaricensis TaxID=334426 RepID=A0A0R3PL46_ANGCS|nr:unnamed protein product [Angiostrongylus costaricensis]
MLPSQTENATTDVLFTVETGRVDYLRTGFILSFTNISNASLPSQGNKLPSQWWPRAETPECNSTNSTALTLEGTNGDFFKAFIEKSDSLPIFISDVCRFARFLHVEVSVMGISGYRFSLPHEEFDYSQPENCGFCNPNTLSRYGAYDRPVNSSCLPTGLLDISGCKKSPIIISKPHFYQANDIVRSFVPRFKPSYGNDETTLDIEPTTGTVLAANKRLQINVLVNQFPTIGAYSVIRPGAYPLVWLNESFSMDEGTRNDLNSKLFQPKRTVEISCWSAIGVGGEQFFNSSLPNTKIYLIFSICFKTITLLKHC